VKPVDVDLNADLGESFGRWTLGDDAAMLAVITSANVACGFHAGDPSTLRSVCAQAAERGVVIGAQVGYADLVGFGRRFVDVAPQDLTNDVLYQIGGLEALARAAGARVSYVKPHGALYNAVVAAVARYDATLPVLGLPGSALLRLAAESGLRTVTEAFADRAYTPDGRLVSRREPGAVLHDAEEIADRSVRLAAAGEVVAVDGTVVKVTARSICVHGDTPGAVTIARAVRDALERAGVPVRSFAARG
jgi:UPF0271 protein